MRILEIGLNTLARALNVGFEQSKTYHEERARPILENTKEFMRHLATKLSEEGSSAS